ncbi:hypothetical protein [Actinoplanes auranticolor]|uniref:Uncharacterized protein n=1 Tax=Actinoplanes auranticolor TaxID=47988 RepID=A0A919T0S4_9ACTN|nr:hypothetical protein [Actinoplanes auranticolor]GIM80753.1 hypothetical protein Aau02nite_91950 [Actinoplanes auranticolor]
MQIEPRHEFAYGFTSSRSTRLGVAIAIAVIGVPAGFGAGLLFGLVLAFAVNPDGDAGAVIAIPIVLALLGAGLFGVWALVNILRVTRTSAWRHGSRLTVRHVRSRTADLTRARSIEIRPTRLRWRDSGPGRTDTIPELVVIGEPAIVHMRLSTGEGQPLPPQDIAALISVLSSTGGPGAAHVVQYLSAGYR